MASLAGISQDTLVTRVGQLEPSEGRHYTSSRRVSTLRSDRLETHGPLGTLWVSLGLGCFYIALIWLNTLLGFFLTPLFVIPATWLTDRMPARNKSTSSP
jgi:hypothetical protein